MPTISVIVPVYKVEPYLHQCVDSILNQTFKDFELILVDDGSPDSCPQICDDYAKKDSRVKVIHKENGGLSSARNAGLDWVFEHSNSEYISFVDSDDWIDRDFLNWLLFVAKRSSADVVMSSVIEVYRNKKKAIMFKVESFHSSYIFYKRSKNNCYTYTTVWGKLFSLKSIGNLRFKNGTLREDEFFSNSLYKNDFLIATVESFGYYYRKRDTGIVGSKTPRLYIDGVYSQIERVRMMKKGYYRYDSYVLNYGYGALLFNFKSMLDIKGAISKVDIIKTSFNIFMILPTKGKYLYERVILSFKVLKRLFRF